jgi:catechol 2,3-dioxygenase-like lactoylglutathione lyase family enzyme
MITGLDYVAIAVENFSAAVEQYTLLLGRPASGTSEVPAKRAALFELRNSRILLLEADARLDGVHALGLAVANVTQSAAQLAAAGIASTPLHDHPAGQQQVWELPADKTRNLPLQLVERTTPILPAANSFAPDHVEALDHVVIRTAAPDDSITLYSGTLGIRLALDRVLGGVRMLFFRTGGVTLEVVTDASTAVADTFYGLAYRVRDLEATHVRLTAAGFTLTEPRVGRKSGTHVFSVRSSTCGVPTLFIRDASRD